MGVYCWRSPTVLVGVTVSTALTPPPGHGVRQQHRHPRSLLMRAGWNRPCAFTSTTRVRSEHILLRNTCQTPQLKTGLRSTPAACPLPALRPPKANVATPGPIQHACLVNIDYRSETPKPLQIRDLPCNCNISTVEWTCVRLVGGEGFGVHEHKSHKHCLST